MSTIIKIKLSNNTYIFDLSVDNSPTGSPIKYGQRFAIMTIDEKVK